MDCYSVTRHPGTDDDAERRAPFPVPRRDYLQWAVATGAATTGLAGVAAAQDDGSLADDPDARDFYVKGEGPFSLEVTGEVEPYDYLKPYVEYGTHYGDDWIDNELSDNPDTNYNDWWFTGDVDDLEYADGQLVEVDGESLLVDAHLHLVPDTTMGRNPLDADQLVSWMDDNGVDRGVVLPLDSPEAYPVTAPNWWVFEECAQYPDRLHPFFTVDPRRGVYGRDTVEERFQQYVNEGASGFGEFKPGLPIDDDRMHTIYELCATHDLPILFHADDKACTDDLDHSQLEAVLASYPDVDFLGHGMGWWARISGDVTEDELGSYPSGSVEPDGAVPRLLSEYDNVYGELSGGSGWNALTRDPEFGQSFLESHSDQLVFGTDYLYPGQDVPNFQLFDEFNLDDHEWADVRYRNLESVLLA